MTVKNNDYSTQLFEKDGKIYFNYERIILTSSKVFGILRKELIDYISKERIKGFLFRYGWHLGKSDAQIVKKKNRNKKTLEEVLSQGPTLHMLKGYTKVKRSTLKIEYNNDNLIESVKVEGNWYNSYEAEEHYQQYGASESPVCFTLIGYASGYYSEILQKTVFFKEIHCKASGYECCTYVGKTLNLWGPEIEEELNIYKNVTIAQELESTYEQLLEERNNLKNILSINELLTEELAKGKNLQTISQAVYEKTKIPIMIQDRNLNLLFHSGIDENFIQTIYPTFKKVMANQKMNIHSTREITTEEHSFLITPIFLLNNIFGFCTFWYKNLASSSKVDRMILERVATIASIHILNEKNAFEATEHMKGHFLNQLIDRDLLTKDEIVQRGNFVNLNLNDSYFIAVIKIVNQDNENELLFNKNIMGEILHFFRDKMHGLIGQRYEYITLLIQRISKEMVERLLKNFIVYFKKSYPACSLQIGVSRCSTNIEKVKDYYNEALTALRTSDTTKEIRYFEEVGMIGILLNWENKKLITDKAFQLLRPIDNLKQSKKEFIKTLYIFLKNGGNLEKTSEELSLSLSGLRYRISKLEEILGKDLRDPTTSYQLLIGLQVLMLEGEITID